VTTPHEILNPDALSAPRGFSHAVAASGGRTLYLGGQTAHDADGRIVGESVVEQFDRAAANVVTVLEAAGGEPDDLTSMMIYVTDAAEYRASLKALGEVYRRRFGTHYPAIALFEVAGLFDPAAKVELVCTAVLTGTARGQ
jgi:enamine deaminase RidA (YjgF/YER057c/UK114 family)